MIDQIIKPQSDFVLLERYKKAFTITPDTIFAYDDIIYSNNNPLPDYLIIHEQTHFKQQKEVGLGFWVDQFIADPVFRLKQEIEAYKNQLALMHNKGQKRKMRYEIAEHLSSSLYGHMITKEDVLKIIK